MHGGVSGRVLASAFRVHSVLGPGLLESAYERCLGIEMVKRGMAVERQVALPITYEGHVIDSAYRVDLIAEGSVLVELKAVEQVLPIHQAQLLTYLRLSGLHVGLLLNFNVPHLRDGITRRVL